MKAALSLSSMGTHVMTTSTALVCLGLAARGAFEVRQVRGAACIPMALDDAVELGKIKRGDLVVMIASGVGYNQAAAAVRMTI
jgi:3-Oxoacyl-[acyl-carrier-protein (ACP)] synthase III C terminal